jgi:D-alanyl-D-alanine dipeptidase
VKLASLTDLIPDAIIDLRYATPDNIAGELLYQNVEPQLIQDAGKQLAIAANVFRKQGLHLVVWDALRPLSVQKKLRTIYSDDHYILEDSNHCKGRAVDVTLAYSVKRYLDMGTDYDDFSPRSHVDASNLSLKQKQNRQQLKHVMEQAGFISWPYEWWHFDFLT